MTNEAIVTVLEHFHNELMAVDSAEGALRSIDDLRELLSEPPPPAAREEFDLLACVAAIVEIVNLTSGRRIERVADGTAPSFPVVQDFKAVEQVLIRVLDSAVKLAPSGTIQVSVGTGPGPDLNPDSIRVEIRVGAPELAARLCEGLKLRPAGADLREAGDVPLALALMAAGQRLRALGGAAAVTEASVTLDFPGQARRPENVSQRAGSRALNILVAEDNDESFALTRMMLEQERVSRARDGREALQMMENQRFDMVFMDIHMPGMDGYAAIRQMRDWETQNGRPRTTIVVLSGDDVEIQRKCASECGCSGFLNKPLRQADLAPLMGHLKSGAAELRFR